MQNPDSHHNYFAWPTAARLQNGKIAVVASGFRMAHLCPFGKLVIAYSDDEGESYTAPGVIMDTPLDDRDGGVTFGPILKSPITSPHGQTPHRSSSCSKDGTLRNNRLDDLIQTR